MTEERFLKREYIWQLSAFIVFNLCVFWTIIVIKDINFSKIETILSSFSFQKGTLAILLPLLTVILNGILPNNLKAILVFWKIKDPLPGSRVFTNLALKDPRIDLEKIRQKYGDLPSLPNEQNRLWYKIYKQHQSKITIVESHKDFLLTRDLASVSAIFLVCFSLSVIFLSGAIKVKFGYIVFLIFQYIILARVSKNYGERFVCNVLAEESV
jgi:hypothetical protein